MAKIILVLLLMMSSVHAQPVWLVAPSPGSPASRDSRIKFRVGAALLAVGLAVFVSALPLDVDGLGKSGLGGHRGDLELISSFGFFLGGGATAIAGASYLSKYDGQ